MVILIKNAEVYAPGKLGRKDVLVLDQHIAAIGDNLKVDFGGAVPVTEVDGTDMVLTPGFIDSHVHVLGGGGEGGFATRTPEAVLTDFTTCGITTVCGLIGTDGVTRDMRSLVAKVHGLDEEGISTYCYTGNYKIPINTLTGDVMTDIMMIDKCIGVGEVALSDHRSSQPTQAEFERIVADARVAGMLSGKAGILDIHLGDSTRYLDMILALVHNTEIPYTQILPTHINRNAELFDAGLDYVKEGGYIDFTGNADIDYWETVCSEVRVCKGFRRYYDLGLDPDHFTMSSDGQGSMPVFDANGVYKGIGVANSACLLKEIRESVDREALPLDFVLRCVTSNPAKLLKLHNKGHIQTGYDADILLLNKQDLSVNTVIAKGQIMVSEGKPVKFGTFEHIRK